MYVCHAHHILAMGNNLRNERRVIFRWATQFLRNVLGRDHKRKVVAVEDFDPRPVKYRGTVKGCVPALLDKIREGLCISLFV